MGAIEYFLAKGIRLELQLDNNIRAIGRLDDALRSSIKAQKLALIGELQWREFESLLAIVGSACNTPPHEYELIRQAARRDLQAALEAYRGMARQIEANR